MANPILKPVAPRASYVNMKPEDLKKRACEVPGMTGVRVQELFSELPDGIVTDGPETTRKIIHELTLKELENIDLSMIGPGDSVNLLCSHHGFTIYGGEAYVEMMRTIRDEIERRCGTNDIRLRAGVGLRFAETAEYIKKFGLDEYFHGKAKAVCPIDEGVAIETDIGTVYGIKEVYDAKWIIHCHNNDIRELHYHRQIRRLFKPFAMSYARTETRSAYHQSMGPRASNLLPSMIFESEFVQEKFVAAFMFEVAPTGMIGIRGSNNLYELDDELTKKNLVWYGKVLTLLDQIKDTVMVIDYPGPMPYTTSGGILFGNFLNATVDEFDLSHCWTPFTRYTDMMYPGDNIVLHGGKVPPPNPAIRSLVVNYASKGYPGIFFAQQLPTLVVKEQADLIRTCPQNQTFMDFAVEVENIDKAIRFGKLSGRTENVLIFDGAVGGFNVSEPLAEMMYDLAPEVSREVDEVRMPLWLSQRGIQPAAVR